MHDRAKLDVISQPYKNLSMRYLDLQGFYYNILLLHCLSLGNRPIHPFARPQLIPPERISAARTQTLL
jgi:hypothetical protein